MRGVALISKTDLNVTNDIKFSCLSETAGACLINQSMPYRREVTLDFRFYLCNIIYRNMRGVKERKADGERESKKE
jgi:hypothetical protein